MTDELIRRILPEMYSGVELDQRLLVLPPFDPQIRNASDTERLIALQSIYDVFVPNQMSCEVYSKLYLALLRSFHKKHTLTAIKQTYENSKIIRQQSYESILGGADAFTIIGPSGVGKSSAVSRAIRLLMPDPYVMAGDTKIIPALTVQAPADASVKGLLFEFLRKVDEYLDTTYFSNAQRTRATVDILIGSVSQIALNHIGLLVVDEVQNVVNSKNGQSIVGFLTQLINNSGVSICMVGTEETAVFFKQAFMLARRAVGLHYRLMEYTDEFKAFCRILLQYLYVQKVGASEETITRWLYEHSQGNISVVVSLLHDAQEIAILSGRDIFDITALNEALNTRLEMLHDYVIPDKKRPPSIKRKEKVSVPQEASGNANETDISKVLLQAKHSRQDAVKTLKTAKITIDEVQVV